MKNFNLNRITNSLDSLRSSSKVVHSRALAYEALLNMACFSIIGLRTTNRPFAKVNSRLESFEVGPDDAFHVKKATVSLFELYAENEPYTDILSILQGEYIGYEEKMGQFMTPPDVSELCAAISFSKMDTSRIHTIGDVAGCGCGSMLLGALRFINRNHGKEGVASAYLKAVEIDKTLSKACIIQIEMGSIMHGVHHAGFDIYSCNPLTEYPPKPESCIYQSIPDFRPYELFDKAA